MKSFVSKLEGFIGSVSTKKAIWIIIIVGFIVFFNSLNGALVGDDISQVLQNSYIRSLDYVSTFFTNPSPLGPPLNRYYRPLMFTSYTVTYTLFGSNVFFYHLLQLCLQISSAILVFWLLKKFVNNGLSLFLSLVFLVHPINSEVVSYVADLQDGLFLFFGLLSFYFVASGRFTRTKRFIFASLFLSLSFFSKETAVLFIPVIILYCFLYKKSEIKLSVTASLISAGLYLFARFVIAKVPIVHGIAPTALLLNTTVLAIPKMFYYYVSTFLFPEDLSLRHSWLVRAPTFSDFYFPLVIDVLFLIFLVAGGYYIFKKGKSELTKYIFFIVWFFLGIAPNFQLWVLDSTVAERWFYFPIIGLLGAIGLMLSRVELRRPNVKSLIVALAFIILILLGARTIIRNANWQSRLTLYQHDFSLAHDTVLGNLLMQEYIYLGQFDDARKLLPVLVDINPNDPINISYRAVIEMHEGNTAAAEVDLRSILSTKYSGLSYQALPKILFDKGDSKSALELLLEGVKLYPNDPVLWRNLAYIEYKLGNLKEASSAAQKINLTIQQIVGQ